MDKIAITLQPVIDQNAINHVRSAINRMRPGEEITITIESTDAYRADPIINLLEQSGCDYQSKGSHDGKNYHINACKPVH
jgi:TusA-related sulfurtransferase